MTTKKKTKNKLNAGAIAMVVVVLFLIAASFSVIPNLTATSYSDGTSIVADSLGSDSENSDSNEKQKEPEPKIQYIPTPEATKTIYMTACVAGTPSFRQDLVNLTESTEINSIIIDIKDFSGTISFDMNPEEVAARGRNEMKGTEGPGCRVSDMKEFVADLHDRGIYVIGRVTVFQDPFYSKLHPELAVKRASDGAVWKDHKGISFIEVGAKPYWDYILDLAKESHEIGFDEINFDYIRFPSDGNMKDIHFPFSEDIIAAHSYNGKSYALEEFFKYLKADIDEYNSMRLEEGYNQGMVTSADLFGMVTTNTDDLNIGQVLEKALPYFDYIAPMVYPSHYPPHFNGWPDPNLVAGELIHFVMAEGVRRVEEFDNATSTPASVRDHVDTDQLRPWLQDFDYGGNYGPAEVRAQIQSTYDSGLDSWMLWAPSNRYTRGALLEE
jgi:hypothetical protein